MDWLAKIFGGSVGNLAEQVGGVVDKFHLSGEEKQKFKLEMEALLQKRDAEVEATLRTELGAKERVLVAELNQGDNYTKRARPTVVYAGLGFILFNYCLVPLLQTFMEAEIQPFELPGAFWAGWSGIVATWSIGRSMEKRGAQNRFTSIATGNGSSRLLGDRADGDQPVG